MLLILCVNFAENWIISILISLSPQCLFVTVLTFSQTWLRYLRLANGMANPSVWLSVCLSSVVSGVCRLWRACTLLRGQLFVNIFTPFCNLAIRQLTHQKSGRSSKGITPSEQISLTGVWLCNSSKVAEPPHIVTFGYLISWWVSCSISLVGGVAQ